MSRSLVTEAQHWVIKLGSNVLLRDGLRLDRPTFAALLRGIDALLMRGIRVTVVSSGAVALGRQRLGGKPRPVEVPQLQALAALGQPQLMSLYHQELSHYDRLPAQVLLTREDLDDRHRYLNARAALDAIQQYGALPIINENDTVAIEELCFGDNDQLAAMVCGLVQADLLVILSDVPGIFEVSYDTHGERVFGSRIPEIASGDARLDAIAGPSQSGVGTGGMVTKVQAARIAARVGAATVIAPGKLSGVLESLASGDDLGTLLLPGEHHGALGKKVWLGAGALAVGTLRCDRGAQRAVVEQGASLLPSGVRAVEGEFERGAVVDLVGPSGQAFARGISAYSAEELRRLAGVQSAQIARVLGYKLADALIHRDELVLL